MVQGCADDQAQGQGHTGTRLHNTTIISGQRSAASGELCLQRSLRTCRVAIEHSGHALNRGTALASNQQKALIWLRSRLGRVMMPFQQRAIDDESICTRAKSQCPPLFGIVVLLSIQHMVFRIDTYSHTHTHTHTKQHTLTQISSSLATVENRILILKVAHCNTQPQQSSRTQQNTAEHSRTQQNTAEHSRQR